jgi:hypothetical protein
MMQTPLPQYQTVASVNPLSIISLPMALVFPPAGIGLAYLARAEIRRTGERGRGLSTAALVLGYAACALWGLFFLMLALAVATDPEISGG